LENSDADIQMLGRLLKVLHERPHYNLSHLIGYWRGIYGEEATERLAKIAGSDLLQAANALTAPRDDKAAKADYDSEAAFLGCIESLKLAQQKQAILASQTVAHQTEFGQLTDAQKAQIKASLQRKE
jgi:DNA primase